MNILYLMIPISLLLGLGFLFGFIWAVGTGQIDDIETPAYRILDEGEKNEKHG